MSDPRIIKLLPTQLNFDMTYQRQPLNQDRVDEMCRNPQPRLFGFPVVTQRPDGSYWCIDGQHRTHFKLKTDPSTPIACELVHTSGVEDEARLFREYQQKRRGLNQNQLYQAGLAAKEPLHLGVQGILDKHKLRVKTGQDPQHVTAIKEVLKFADRDGGLKIVDDAFTVLIGAYTEDVRSRLLGSLFAGVCLLLREGAEVPRLMEVVQTKLPKQWATEADAGSGVRPDTGPKICEYMRKKYNSRLKGNRRLPH